MKKDMCLYNNVNYRYYIIAIIFIVFISSCSSPPEKTLNDKLRPFQTGSEVDVAANEYDNSPRGSCSYGFHAISYGKIGLVTALHCTNTDYDYDGGFVVSGEKVWQSYTDDAYAVATVERKPTLLDKWDNDSCLEAIEDLGRDDLRWCLLADAAFAPFVDQSIVNDGDLYQAGAVANVPLSIDETNLGPVAEDDPHFYTGYSYLPTANQPLYKIGSTTGKTVGYLVSELPVDIPISLEEGGEEVVLLGVYSARSSNAATFADHGDSGGPVFHTTSGDDGPFTLAGIVSAGTNYGLLFVEPLGDILASIDIEVEYAGSGGYLGIPQ